MAESDHPHSEEDARVEATMWFEDAQFGMFIEGTHVAFVRTSFSVLQIAS